MAIAAIRREVVAGWNEIDSPVLRLLFLVFAASWNYGPLLDPAVNTEWLYEDVNSLPWVELAGRGWRVHYAIWDALRLVEPWQHHLLNLNVHALTSLMIGLVAVRLFRSQECGWACGSIFWLHPLATPAVGYASALPEMLVCLGAVTLTWTLLQDRTWPWLGAAGVILFVTLNVKESAIGVVLLPAVMLLVRPIRYRTGGWIVLGLLVSLLIGVIYSARVAAQLGVYPWHRWPEEMLPMAAQAWVLVAQSILPFGIAFQLDPVSLWFGVLGLPFLWMVPCGLLANRRQIPAFACFYVLALITVRLVVPTSNWLDRAPEMWYTQQWYPALPGMVWLLVSFFAGDASRDEPSAS